jgi:hypothetical protein
MDSLLEDLRHERQHFGATMTSDECVALINAVLWKNRGRGFKQPEKPGGNSGRRRDGKRCSVDGIVFSNPGQPDDRTFIDALKDAGGKSIPAWQVHKIGLVASDGHTIGPWTGPMLEPINPDPDGPPVPNGDDAESLRAEVDQLRSEVTQLRSDLTQARMDLQDALQRLASLQHPDLP